MAFLTPIFALGMTTGEIIVLLIFVVGLICSITLFTWLVRLVRRDSKKSSGS